MLQEAKKTTKTRYAHQRLFTEKNIIDSDLAYFNGPIVQDRDVQDSNTLDFVSATGTQQVSYGNSKREHHWMLVVELQL